MRLRIAFSKHGKIRFTSHRDVARIWERALRRTNLPVAYSEGFTPRPKLSFGLALSTGHESEGEYLDVDLDPEQAAELDLHGLTKHLTAQLPVGMTATGVVGIDRRMPSLQQAVTSCTWQIDVLGVDEPTARAAIDAALNAAELMVTRERKGKEVTDDIRPLVFSFEVDQPIEDGVRLRAELGTQPRAVRVSELLAALDPPLAEPMLREPRVLRLHQWITTDDGQRHDPMSVAAAASAPAGVS
ncbi:MAG: TIGR03936 family radical SAM-associated protein [Actinomycetota bacterium]